MASKDGKRRKGLRSVGGQAKTVEDDIDGLFRLPLAEFTAARNGLSARLKKEGQPDDAGRIKLLAKPPISAWAVNQLYWNHHDEFERLLATGQRFRQAQKSRSAGKVTDMREALDERREALANLSELASELLKAADHNPTLDTIRRITATLEALSAYESLSDGPALGRLTQDVDPPGFESLSSFTSGTSTTKRLGGSTRPTPSQKSTSRQQATTSDAQKRRQVEEMRQAKITAAKVSLQSAKKSLSEARARVQELETGQKNVLAESKEAEADAKEAEKQLREAERRFKKAKADSEDATERVRNASVEIKDAAKALEEAKRTVEKATKELETLFRASPGE